MSSKRPGIPWAGTERSQVVFLRVISIVVLTLGVAGILAIVLPVRSALRSENRARFEAEALLVRDAAATFFRQAEQIASQIPSRTRIREELVAYLDGRRSQDSYREFAEPKLEDALRASAEVVAVIRVDPSGTPLASVGPTPPVPAAHYFDPRGIRIAKPRPNGGGRTVELVAPIIDPEAGLVGYDVVSVSLDPLRTAIGSTAARFANLSVTVSAVEQRVFTLPARDTSPKATVSITAEVAPNWTVTVSQTEDALYLGTRRFVFLLSLAVGTITLLLLAIIRWSLSIVLRRGELRAEELTALVEERTEELNRALEARGVLLREVHHRIKNDLAMVGSLLTLRRQEARQEESQSALAEAEAHVRTVGSIYDALYRAGDYGRVRIKEAFEQLFTDVVASHQGQPDAVDLTVHVDDLELDRQVAAPVGIITNELIINALKYGRPETGRPRISVTIAAGTPTGVHILVTDNGPAIDPVQVETATGFGMVMVRALAEQFSGTVRVPGEYETGAVEVLLRDTEE